MKKTRTTLKVSDIELNTGQLEWLPRNPRQWDKDDIRRTAASIQEDPDFLEDRPVLAVPFGDKYIAFGGNLRSISCGKAKVKEVPSMVYVPETEEDYATIKRRAMKDNGSFGKWDYDTLANEWDDQPLTDWGVPVWNGDEGQKAGKAEDYGETFQLSAKAREGYRQITITATDDQAGEILRALDYIKYTDEYFEQDQGENENSNGLALYCLAAGFMKREEANTPVNSLAEAEAAAEGLRQYLRKALEASGKTAAFVDQQLGTSGMSGHYFGASQWMFPTRQAYEKMRTFMDLPREWKECKKIEREYNRLKMLEKKWEELKK